MNSIKLVEVITIFNTFLVAISLSMDAFALAFSYGLLKIKNNIIIVTSIIVGLFHFIMPLLGYKFSAFLFSYTFIKPKIVLFLIFLFISIDMLFSYFEKNNKLFNLNLFGILLFSFSVSIDSFTVGIGFDLISNNILLSAAIFSVISSLFTILGFLLGKKFNNTVGKKSFLIGSFLLFLYAVKVLTK